jgi:hypothetical protein
MMPWYLHLFWGAIVYLAACQIARGVATAGEWVGKAIMRHGETLLALQREALARSSRRGDRP